MTDFELFQNKAELKKLGPSEIPADVVEDDAELEEDLFDWGEEMPSSEKEFLIPVPVSTTGAGNEDAAPAKKAEVIEEESHAAVKAAGYPGPLPPIWRPFLPYPLTAQILFDLALTVVTVDPARLTLGFYYKAQLKRECELLIPHPIPSFFSEGIRTAREFRRNNPAFFVCNAIDIVLTAYLNEIFNKES